MKELTVLILSIGAGYSYFACGVIANKKFYNEAIPFLGVAIILTMVAHFL